MRLNIGKVLPSSLLLAAVGFSQQMAVDFDPAATKINWSLVGNVHTTHGTFQLKQGHVEVNAASGAVSGELIVEANSGNSNDGARDKRMKKEILETDKFPEIRFRVTRIEGAQQLKVDQLKNAATVRAVGQFTIHGSSHEISIPMQVQINGSDVSGTGKFVVPFVDWGMKDPSNFLFKVNKTVEVELVAAGHIKR